MTNKNSNYNLSGRKIWYVILSEAKNLPKVTYQPTEILRRFTPQNDTKHTRQTPICLISQKQQEKFGNYAIETAFVLWYNLYIYL